MPISRKEYDEGKFTTIRGRASDILEYFKANKDKAYTSSEIAVIMKTNQPSVTPILKKLIDNGFLEKKHPYYSLSKEDNKIKVIQEKGKSIPEKDVAEKVQVKTSEVEKEEEEEFFDEPEFESGPEAESQ